MTTTMTTTTTSRAAGLIVALAALTAGGQAAAQRSVTPVTPSHNRTMTTTELAAKQKELASQGYVILGDSIVSDSVAMMENDSIRALYMQYPKLTSVIVGVNLWDPLMRLFGQSYGGIDFSAELSMWNRFHPIVEIGAGWVSSTPDDMNFTYKGDPALYGKIGMNYNLKYNNSPDYVALLGLRACYTSFSYDITDVSIVNSYWDQTKTIEILNQKSNAIWWEILVSLKVKLWQNISAGWAVRYHFLYKYKSNDNSKPWYIPGYGTRSGNMTGSFSLYYTIPLGKKRVPDPASVVGVDDGAPPPPPPAPDSDDSALQPQDAPDTADDAPEPGPAGDEPAEEDEIFTL